MEKETEKQPYLNIFVERSDLKPMYGVKRLNICVLPNELVMVCNHGLYPFAISKEASIDNIVAGLVDLFGAQHIADALATTQKERST